VSITVLIVDDDAGFRAIARRLLERGGLEVVGEAGDGASAVALCEACRPDGVLLDVNLPDTTGPELASRLPGVRVLLTSTDDTAGDGRVPFVPKARLFEVDLASYFTPL
jgi:DNA-binding NarL/FixJ family response regulator